MQELIIEGRLPSRNEAENASRTNFAVGAKFKREHTERVAWECKTQKIKAYDVPIKMDVTFYEKDYRRDSDNIYAGMKYIKDGLVMAKILPNDTRKWVNERINEIEVDKVNPRIVVKMWEKEDKNV